MAAAKKPKTAATAQAGAVSEAQPSAGSGWTPDQIESARKQVATGNYAKAAELTERLLADSRIDGVTEKLAAVAQLPLHFKPGAADTQAEEDPLCQALEVDWWEMLTEEHLSHLVKWGRVLGYSWLHITSWEAGKDGRLLPQIETWNPRNTKWDQSKRQWYAITATGDIPIEPGDGGWILWTPYGSKRPASRAPWCSLGYWWLLKAYAVADWGLYSNRQGQGVWSAVNTSGTISTDDAGRQKLAQSLANMGRRGSAVPPDGFDLKLIESVARTWETFQAQIKAANDEFAVALAGQNLSTEVTGGSYAAATVHQAVEAKRIKSIAEGLATCLRSQLLTWWAALNFGADKPVPWPAYETEAKTDTGEVAKRLYPIGAFLGQLVDRGVDVDVIEFAEQFGIKIPLAEGPDAVHAKPKDQLSQQGSAQTTDPTADPAPQASMRARINAIQALATGTRDGSDYADRIEEGYLGAAIEALGPDIDAVLECVRKAETPEALRVELARAYADMDPARFASLIEQAETLAHMAGRVSVLQDL